ncbi:AraC-like DNA-binding protein [Paenibacillus mucilaginosus]|uniref:helix-turn-helix domain-containing protein n=1 Tax=Paenibacillus mucilaginosus TaxID=61624 RepID=UPI003D24DB91
MRKLWNHYRVTVFTRMILSYTILVVILLALAGGYLYSEAHRLMEDEIARDSRTRLQTVKDYMEETVLTKYQDDLQNRVSYSAGPNNQLYYLMDVEWEGNISRIMSLRQHLEFLKVMNEGIANLTVYFRQGHFVVDSQGFFTQPEHSADAEFILSLDRIPAKTWLVRTLPSGKQALSYVVKLPYPTPTAPGKAYFFVDVDMDFIRGSASKMLSSPSDRLYLVDQAGSVVMRTSAGEDSELELLKQAIDQGAAVMKLSDDRLGQAILSYLPATHSSHGWSYAIVRSMNSFQLSSKAYQTSIFVGCGAVLLIGLLISYMLSRQFYNPIQALIGSLRRLHPAHAVHSDPRGMNEYAMINNALLSMDQKIKSLEHWADGERMVCTLLGTGQGTEFPEALLGGRGFQTAYIRMVEGRSEALQRWYDLNDHPPQCELIFINSEECALLYKTNDHSMGRDEVITLVLMEMKEAARGSVRFGAAVGPWVSLPEEIQISYEMAVQTYRYRFLYGAEAVILHSHVTSLDPKPHLFSFELFTNALRAGSAEGAKKFLCEFAHVLNQKRLKLEAVEMALLQLVTSLYQVVIDLELENLLPHANLFDEVRKAALAETMDSIRAISSRIAVHVREGSTHAHAEVIFKLKKYIDDHLQDDLSLNVMSDVASLAPAYISTLFGEVMRESFTEYVTRVRLERAASLLCENDRMSITEIASRVGYRNSQYFHSKFKARYGITPLQYRHAKTIGPVET